MAARKDWGRLETKTFTEDSKGPLFISELGQHNFSGVHVLHSGLDTVRQLYHGNLNAETLDLIVDTYSSNFGGIVDIAGVSFVVGSGSRGGYRYSLQNLEYGLIALLGSRYADLDEEASHLKIEVSPHYIHERDIKTIQSELDALARVLLLAPTTCGVAVHICADIQGWVPPEDFEKCLVTRSKRQFKIQGIDSIQLENSGIAAIHGDRESFTYGSASALQFSLYQKQKEAKYRDKFPYWVDKWSKKTDENFKPLFNPEKPVWRFEFRFHHNVIKEFARGLETGLNSLAELELHLTGLWQYACNTYRLDQSRTYINPFWQLLRDDVSISGSAPHILYKRVRKGPGVGNERNVAAAIGNLITIYSKNGIKAKQAYHFLEVALGLDDFLAWQMKKELSKSAMIQFLEHELSKRRLLGIAA